MKNMEKYKTAHGGLVEASRATTENSSAVGDTAHRRELSKNTSKNGVDFGQLGNGAKMRKALLFVKQYFDKIDPFNIKTYTFAQIEVDYIKAAISAALSAPPRNCDVGTAEEQVERFKEYCQSNMQYYQDMFGTHEGAGGWDCKEDCPIGKMVEKNDSFCDHCELLWAQMPYEEGGSK